MFFRFNNKYTYLLFFVLNAMIFATLLYQNTTQSKAIALFPFILCILLVIEVIGEIRKNSKDK